MNSDPLCREQPDSGGNLSSPLYESREDEGTQLSARDIPSCILLHKTREFCHDISTAVPPNWRKFRDAECSVNNDASTTAKMQLSAALQEVSLGLQTQEVILPHSGASESTSSVDEA